ncbi:MULTISPECIES: sulfur carrier protein ThiS [Clostridium]|uniref:sulfur carrier protein ThiS n=1 Tax=Clostridium TaxID=1485 RepID=UPI000C0729EB|nr:MULTISPECIES: sulfur carrier protein ThiS [Clostridium]MDB2091828.1 sulfur carrier protein ThiS [Clostridium paraputrificum]MDU3411379.1 sulfur carrier protein ThiS [Clostridium sp.]MDU5740107.1 sulfur carrier protein ThiS [Clostridium sp.]MDU5784219.1 sulfur carrier protein ThiS [Clostridium sp.]
MIKVNGELINGCEDKTLSEFLSNEGYEITRIAVELNGEIARKKDYQSIILKENDTLEVVTFVGGG